MLASNHSESLHFENDGAHGWIICCTFCCERSSNAKFLFAYLNEADVTVT